MQIRNLVAAVGVAIPVGGCAQTEAPVTYDL